MHAELSDLFNNKTTFKVCTVKPGPEVLLMQPAMLSNYNIHSTKYEYLQTPFIIQLILASPQQ